MAPSTEKHSQALAAHIRFSPCFYPLITISFLAGVLLISYAHRNEWQRRFGSRPFTFPEINKQSEPVAGKKPGSDYIGLEN